MQIKIPDGVGAVSLGVIGDARVLLRSDRYLHCTECNVTALTDATPPKGDECEHLEQVLRLGVVRVLRDEEGRAYPEFVWHRSPHRTVAFWPPVDDPDNARGVLLQVLKDATRLDEAFRKRLVQDILTNLRYRGYCVVPEWAAGPRKARPALSGRGARLFDLTDEEPAEAKP